MTGWRRLVLVALAATMTACSGAASGPAGGRRTATATSVPPASGLRGDTPAATTPYEATVDAAARRRLQVWIETDLAKFWLRGRPQFDAAVRGLAALANRPGVVGVKIADELGYKDGFGDPRRVRAFLDDAAHSLRRAAPNRLILVDFVVPELGCAPGLAAVAIMADPCRAAARARYPALRLEAVDGYLASGDLDVIDLSTGLLEPSDYEGWGIDREAAQRAAWQEVASRGWQRHVVVQARKALAHPGPYPQYQAGSAQGDARVFLDLPREAGAAAVDVWTWRQTYKSEVVRLMDPGLEPNPLWDALRQRRERGMVLFTHFTPSSVERGLDADLDMLSTVFSGVFVAAGLG